MLVCPSVFAAVLGAESGDLKEGCNRWSSDPRRPAGHVIERADCDGGRTIRRSGPDDPAVLVARGCARAGEPMPEAMAVATATIEGRPSARMVLLRGIDHRGLVFYTDQESDKGQELTANPFAAALFHWFKPVHRQVRVTGAVEVVDASLSDAYWQSRPPGSRRSAVASHQSQVVVSRAVLEEEVAKLAEAFPDELGPPRPLRWGGYRIRPRWSNSGKKGRTACTIGFATALSQEVGGSSDCHPDPFLSRATK